MANRAKTTLPTGENKQQFRRRLQGTPRWREFVDCRQRWKDNGLSPWSAWCRAAAMFPKTGEDDFEGEGPDEVAGGVKVSEDVERPGHWSKGGVSSDECISWVFEALGEVGGVVVADAPSAGAWNLFRTCRANPQNAWSFYTNLWSKTIKPSDGREKLVESDDKIEVLIERMQASLEEEKPE